MKKQLNKIVLTSAALLSFVGLNSRADAALISAICNDAACTGGDDFIVQDNGAGDNVSTLGAISFSTSAFGYAFTVNTSQSKPLVGSASSPQLDLSFTATTLGAAASAVYLYASDTDFVNPQKFLLSLGGTNSGNATIGAGASGGTSNTALQLTNANVFSTIGPLSGSPFGGSATSTLTPTINPYSLTIGVAINRTSAGTTTGDLNLQAVPEPASMALLGLGLLGLGAVNRRRKAKTL